jgi:hypothetical protein
VAAVSVAAWRYGAQFLLGSHGAWAFQQAHELFRRASPGSTRTAVAPVASDGLASAGKANSE